MGVGLQGVKAWLEGKVKQGCDATCKNMMPRILKDITKDYQPIQANMTNLETISRGTTCQFYKNAVLKWNACPRLSMMMRNTIARAIRKITDSCSFARPACCRTRTRIPEMMIRAENPGRAVSAVKPIQPLNNPNKLPKHFQCNP